MTYLPLKGLPGNARYCILLEPLWALTGTVVLFYATFYMKSVGLSNLSIGIILSVNLYLGFIFQILAGAVTDRLGRRRTSLVFDLLGWALPMLLWAVADNFWVFLIAYLFFACSTVVNISFSLLATEDTPEADRPRVFAAVKLIALGAGLLTPVAGVLMAEYGVVPTMRIIYLVGAITMLVQFVWRNYLTRETAAGLAAMDHHRSTGMARSVATSLRLFWRLARHRRMWPLIGLQVTTTLAVTINIFQVIYLVEVLKIDAGTISWVPALTAAVALLCFLVLLPRLRERPLVNATQAALVLSAVGWLLFLLTPPHGVLLLMISTAVTAGGVFLTETYRDSLVVSTLEDRDRAAMFGSMQSVTAMVAIPSGFVAALLYNIRPQLLFIIVFLLYAAGAAFAFRLRPSGSTDDLPLAATYS